MMPRRTGTSTKPIVTFRLLEMSFHESLTPLPCRRDRIFSSLSTRCKLKNLFGQLVVASTVVCTISTGLLSSSTIYNLHYNVNRLQDIINEGGLISLKETWWKKISIRGKCEELKEEEDGISIKNIGEF